MRKKHLLILNFPKLSEAMIELAKRDVPKKIGCRYIYKYGLYLRAEKEDGYLILSFFLAEHIRAGAYKPAYVLFIDKAEDKFVTYNVGLERWSNAMLCNFVWPEYVYKSEVYMTEEDKKLVKEYLEMEEGGFFELSVFQKHVRSRELIKRHKKITDPWDEDMKQIPQMPKDWEQWVAKTGIQEHYIFYEYKKGGAKKGYCSHCGKNVQIQNPKYNKKGTCSHCGYPVIYKSVAKFGHIRTEKYCVYLFQRCKDGVVLRQFDASATYRKGNYKESKIFTHEVRRIIYDSNLNGRAYYRGMFKQREYRWIAGTMVRSVESGYYRSYLSDRGKVYPRTLPDLENKELSRTGLPQMIKNCIIIDPEFYMARLKTTPVLEQIVKAGLYRLAMDMYDAGKTLEFESGTGELKKRLGLDRQRLNRLRIRNGGVHTLEWLRAEKRKKTLLPDELIDWFIRNECMPDDFAFIEDRMTFIQIKNYLVRQKKEESDSIKQIVTTWADYLSMAQRIKMDTKDAIVYRTSKLYQRHKEVANYIELKNLSITAKEIGEKYANINQILPELQEKYGYKDGTYMILAPNSVIDILNEGRLLHHCIDKKKEYFERINRQETYILFLRRVNEPDQPYYTLEVEPGGVIRQKRTDYNRQNKDIQDAEEFLRKWQSEIQKKLTEEDLRLADNSQQMRDKEYRELRKKKVYIYGGFCQRKLLADVLESDLMEISQKVKKAA